MRRSAVAFESTLPGYDARHAAATYDQSDELVIPWDSDRYTQLTQHQAYLDNPVYDKYLRMHKVFVGTSGAHELLAIADELEHEELPRYLDAAGWAYAEAGLALGDESAVSRVRLIKEAELCWQRSLQASQRLLENDAARYLIEDSDQLRTALNIAHAPLMKSIVVGNVTDAVRERSFADTLAIGQASAVQMDLALRQGEMVAAMDHAGFIHEANALLTLHYLNNPRYVPLPSTARADTGYYHQEQTHDIAIINQHWGAVKKVIPLEIKAAASARDRQRYKALLVRGKMHLSIEGRYDPRCTLDAFAATYDHVDDMNDQRTVEHATSTMRHLLKLYQQGSGSAVPNTTSRTRFHDNQFVAPYYKA